MDPKASNGALVFNSTSYCITPMPQANTKFFIADTANSLNTLFICRGQFRDSLYSADKKLTNFHKVYETRLTERIFSAAALPGKDWYLICLKMFGDGIDLRTSYRSIFVVLSRRKPVEFPVSTKTYYPQKLSWAYSPESPVFLHTSFPKDKSPIIGTYDFVYDPPPSCTFNVGLRKVYDNYMWFDTGVVGSAIHTFIVQVKPDGYLEFTDRTKVDFFPKVCPLPKGLPINADTEFKVFNTNRQTLSELHVQRCIIHTTTDKVTIILPFAPKITEIEIEKPQIDEEEELSSQSFMDNFNNISQQTSRLPFSLGFNDFFLVAVPHGYITGFLLDQDDRVRASFTIKLPEDCLFINQMSALDDSATYCMYQDTGEIFTCDINYKFFMDRNPLFAIPLLHTLITPSVIRPLYILVNIDLLTTFWNGEFFNEALLLYYNAKQSKHILFEKLCSTFIDPKRLEDHIFVDFKVKTRNDHPMTPIKQVRSFPELVKNIPRSVIETLPPELQNIELLFESLVNLLNESYFDPMQLDEDVRFVSWLQIQAIKHSLLPQKTLLSLRNQFPEKFSDQVISTWAMRNMISLEEIMSDHGNGMVPSEGTIEEKMEAADKIWWHLRTQKVKMIELQTEKIPTNLFLYIEEVTNKADSCGPAIFSMHQFLLKPEMDQPIFE